jgi:hypothetical protein
MSFKSSVLGAAAALTIVSGVSAVGTVASSAATPQCGPHCIEVFSPRFGTADQPKFVETARGGVARIGAAAILYSASSSNPAEDWIVPTGGPVPVSKFFADGLISATVDKHYGKLEAAQIEFAPYGKATGFCTGVSKTPYQNEGLSLQPCKIRGNTVWIIDTSAASRAAKGYFALVNGSSTDFSQPFAMTYAQQPPTQIVVQHLRFSDAGTVPETQLFGAAFGVLSKHISNPE